MCQTRIRRLSKSTCEARTSDSDSATSESCLVLTANVPLLAFHVTAPAVMDLHTWDVHILSLLHRGKDCLRFLCLCGAFPSFPEVVEVWVEVELGVVVAEVVGEGLTVKVEALHETTCGTGVTGSHHGVRERDVREEGRSKLASPSGSAGLANPSGSFVAYASLAVTFEECPALAFASCAVCIAFVTTLRRNGTSAWVSSTLPARPGSTHAAGACRSRATS